MDFLKNNIYARNISPLVTDEHMQEFFGQFDMVESIEFKFFPGTQQRYVQVEYGSSRGVTESMHKNGEMILGVPITLSIIDPTSQAQNVVDAPGAAPPGMAGLASGVQQLMAAATTNLIAPAGGGVPAHTLNGAAGSGALAVIPDLPKQMGAPVGVSAAVLEAQLDLHLYSEA